MVYYGGLRKFVVFLAWSWKGLLKDDGKIAESIAVEKAKGKMELERRLLGRDLSEKAKKCLGRGAQS